MIFKRYFQVLFAASTLLSLHLSASVLISGDCDAPEGATFSFALGQKATGAALSTVYTSALDDNEGGTYSVARWTKGMRGNPCFEPFAPQEVILDGLEGQENPLYNAGFSFLSLLGVTSPTLERPILVKKSSPKNLYVIEKRDTKEVIQLIDIKDADGAVSEGIVGITSVENSVILAAVKAEGESQFGIGASGVAVVERMHPPTEKDEAGNELPKGPATLVQINAQPDSEQEEARAVQLNIDSSVIKVGEAVTSISDLVVLHWSAPLKRFYAAYNVQGASGQSNGARSLVVGAFDVNQKVTFYPIAPDAVFSQDKETEIVGALASDTNVRANYIRTLRTTTSLDYLVVQGGNGSEEETRNTVYALPLVNNLDTIGGLASDQEQSIQGALADVNANPVEICRCDAKNRTELFITRQFHDPATNPNDIFTSESVASRVGGGPLQAGTITDLFVKDEAVFVTVGAADADQLPGVFTSQAILDARGVIIGWTNWKRVAGTTDAIFAAALDPQIGNFVLFLGSSKSTVNTVKKTEWGLGMNPGLNDLVESVGAIFNKDTGGVQGYFDLSPVTPGLHGISLAVATGYQKVALFETGKTVNGTFTPNGGGYSANTVRFDTGAIVQPIPSTTQTVIVSGGIVDDIGPIAAAEIAATEHNGWLFIGGVNGVAVLSYADGSGWNPATQLSNGFAGLGLGMSFKSVGEFCFVRKLIADGNFLYVLTDSSLTRINLLESNFSTGALVSHTVAQVGSIPGVPCDTILLDVLISNKFALLATGTGLYRVGNGGSIQSADTTDGVGWQLVCVPDGIVPALQLSVITQTGREQDMSSGIGSTVYLVNAYIGRNQGRLNRFYVNQTISNDVTDDTITPLPDTQNCLNLSNYGQFGSYRDLFITDGALFLNARNENGSRSAFVQNGFVANSVILPLGIEGASTVVSIDRASSSGSWVVAGDFGLRVNE